VWPAAGGRCPPLDPLHLFLGVPDVSRVRPVQGRLSKAGSEQDFPAQSKATERMFGRGRQSANPRITGGLVSHDQGKRFTGADVSAANAATGSKRAAILVAWSACRDVPGLGSQLRKLTLRRPASVGLARQVVAPGARLQVHQATLPAVSQAARVGRLGRQHDRC
jgi:hypothetical protein